MLGTITTRDGYCFILAQLPRYLRFDSKLRQPGSYAGRPGPRNLLRYAFKSHALSFPKDLYNCFVLGGLKQNSFYFSYRVVSPRLACSGICSFQQWVSRHVSFTLVYENHYLSSSV